MTKHLKSQESSCMLSDKQGYTVSILITAEDMGTQQGKIGPKENQTPRGQTPNLAAPGLAPGAPDGSSCVLAALDSSASLALLPAAHIALVLSQFHSGLKVFLGGCPKFWHLQDFGVSVAP